LLRFLHFKQTARNHTLTGINGRATKRLYNLASRHGAGPARLRNSSPSER
jgi:hypothetical protein